SGYNEEKKTFFEDRNPKYTWRHVGWEQTDEHSVVNVSWNDTKAFCAWLSKKEGRPYRLPTEAEWEYSCRASSATRYPTGDDIERLIGRANIADFYYKEKDSSCTWNVEWEDGFAFTAPVGKFQPNPFGLYDMHGNVWEWCEDWYDTSYYKASPVEDPPAPP